MEVSALDGRTVEVRRRWFPWRLRTRDVEVNDFPLLDAADGIEGLVFSLVFGLIVLVFGGIILTALLFASEALLLLLLVVPLLAAARLFWVLPWIIESRTGATLLGAEKVRGWRASEDRIREIATAYQQGQDPFLGERIA